MKELKTALDVAELVQDFMRNEARTLSLSKGKLYISEDSYPEGLKQVG